jgi:hypothetical protein
MKGSWSGWDVRNPESRSPVILISQISGARLYGCAQAKEEYMIVSRFFGKTGRGLAVAAAMLAAIGLTTAPRPACRGRDRARSLRAWLGAREPLL